MTGTIYVKEIDHVVLLVTNLERSIAFYRAVFGFAVERRIDDPPLVQLRAGRSLLDLMQQPDTLAHSASAIHHVAFRVHSFDEAALSERLLAAGVAPAEITAPKRRYGAEGFGLSLTFTDPDGNLIELKGPPEGALPEAVSSA